MVTDDLRDRVAAAMYEQRRTVSRVPMLSDWAGAHPTVQEMWLATADAVIRELKLEREHWQYGDGRTMGIRYRYVTEWQEESNG